MAQRAASDVGSGSAPQGAPETQSVPGTEPAPPGAQPAPETRSACQDAPTSESPAPVPGSGAEPLPPEGHEAADAAAPTDAPPALADAPPLAARKPPTPTQLTLELPAPPATDETPLVPVRMVNEWVYCPRLAF